MSAWPPRRAAARIAWRQARRAKARTALILVMVGLPIAVMTFVIIVAQTVIPDRATRATERQGTAEFTVEVAAGLEDTDQFERLLPEATVVAAHSRFSQTLIDGRVVGLPLFQYDLPVDQAPVLGMYGLMEGRAPSRKGEAAFDPDTLERLGAGVGDEVALEEGTLHLRVTGAIVRSGAIDQPTGILGPGTFAAEPPTNITQVLIDLPPGADRDAAWQKLGSDLDQIAGGYAIFDREDASEGDKYADLIAAAAAFGITALALFGTGLITAAAFAVGARRQLRTLGLVGAAGGDPKQVRRVVLMGGVVLGFVGSLAGVVLAVALSFAAQPTMVRLSHRFVGPPDISVAWLLGGLLLGTFAAAASAFVPARAAAKLSTVDALAGRPAPPRPPGRLARIGVAVTAAGTAVTVWGVTIRRYEAATAGLVLMISGFLLAVPLVTTYLGRVARFLPAGGRVAARDVARHGRRTAAALAAVTIVLSAPIGWSGLALSEELESAEQPPYLAPDQFLAYQGLPGEDNENRREFIEALRAQFPGVVVGRLRFAVFALRGEQAGLDPFTTVILEGGTIEDEEGAIYSTSGQLAVGGADLLRALHAEDGIAALRAGKIVGVGPDAVDDGVVHLHVPRSDGTETVRDVPAVRASRVSYRGAGFGGESYVVSPEGAARLGFLVASDDIQTDANWVVRTAGPLSSADTDRARRVAARYPGTSVTTLEDFQSGGPSIRTIRLTLMGAGAVLALLIVGVIVALVAAEARRDSAILVAVGAGPGMRRKVAGTRAWLVASLGGALAVPAGFLPVIVVELAREARRSIVVPWDAIALALIGVPLVAGLAAAALSRRPAAAQLLRPIA